MSGLWDDESHSGCVEVRVQNGFSISSVISCCVSGRSLLCFSDTVSKLSAHGKQAGTVFTFLNMYDISGQMGDQDAFLTNM